MTAPNTNEQLETPPNGSSSGSQSTTSETPPTSQPAAPATDPRYLELVEGTIRAQNARLADLERQNAELLQSRSAPPAAPTRTPEEERNAFYENPRAAIREVLTQELKETIAPLLAFANEAKATTQLDKLIAQVRTDPRVSSQWGPRLEAFIRSQLENVPPHQLNAQVVSSVTLAAIGQKTIGMIREDSPSPAPVTPREPVAPAPPYMRPSAPAGPSNLNPAPTHRPLTELELRVLREFNAGKPTKEQMTEAQFLEWQSMPAREVAGYKGDRAPANGSR